jgi:hypothetical protein
MNYKYILLSIAIFLLGQGIVWIQTNGPLIWPWAAKWRWCLILLGVPITWLFMEATRYTVEGFGGVFWPGRFISFVTGITIFALMTWIFRDEAINMKTAVSLILAFILLMIQLFWK